MLVLVRRDKESLRIGDAISVSVLAVDGEQIKFGITAPKTVRVDREEIRRQQVSEAMLRRACERR